MGDLVIRAASVAYSLLVLGLAACGSSGSAGSDQASRASDLAGAMEAAAPQMVAASAPWTMLTVDRTTESGFERTGQVDGFPSFESQATTGGVAQSELAILVGSYIFTLTSRGTDVAGLREIASSLGLGAYAG